DVLLKFHNHAHIAYSLNPFNIQHTFNDILAQQPYLKKVIGKEVADKIENAVKISDDFIQYHLQTFKRRSDLKFVRDVHGDLHSRNIFLTDPPTIFDCIEFNDEIRQVDILNELAFLCMDLEAMDHVDLSTYFMNYYNSKFKVILTKEDTEIFIYYKANRANIRAKVNALRARDSTGKEQKKALSECKKYIELMDGYLEQLVK
ncbi:MAG: hypothetical protein OEW75_17080, partial [Cyclobacteriaceae bacterium]|nr:hypothetical protein [Cyclobacteriaceae bacterium]